MDARRPMSRTSLPSSDNPGPSYDRVPDFPDIARDLDVMVPMRDGVQICVDIYRPKAPGKFPALLAFAIHNKDLQGPDLAEGLPPQPIFRPFTKARHRPPHCRRSASVCGRKR